MMASTWGFVLSVCVSVFLISGVQCVDKAIAAAGVGAAAVVAAPAVLAGAGFGAAGVTAGSLAAIIQTPTTAAGSWFALSQSAGVLGLAGTTKAVVGGVAGGITYVTSFFF